MLDFLKSLDILQGMDDAQIERLHSLLQVESLSAGHVIFNEGDPGDDFFIVKSGTVGIVKNLNKPKAVTLATLRSKDFLGEMGPLSGKPRGAAACCKDDVVLLRMRKHDFLAFIADNPLLSMNLRAIMARRRSDNLETSFKKT